MGAGWDIHLCLFDLDDTLLRTADLEAFRGRAHIERSVSDSEYRDKLGSAIGDVRSRMLYTATDHSALREAHPNTKWGIFTRSPRLYARSLLESAYPSLKWDVVIAREDVRHTKPHGEGVWKAMEACSVKYVNRVALVGDDKADIVAAYHGGCWSILDQSSWPRPWRTIDYWARERMPDAVISRPAQLSAVLESPHTFLPQLEYLEAANLAEARGSVRFDVIRHFFPERNGEGVPITVLGRLFGEYDDIRPRRQWHRLTNQILASKEATEFPEIWIRALRTYLACLRGGDYLVTVIPFKLGRPPRLEALLNQLGQSEQREAISAGSRYHFVPDVLAFGPGALSSHGQHLRKEARFANVGKTLRVLRPDVVKGRRVVVIDDVTTTGATLLWAHRYLRQAGAQEVLCVSLAKAVGEK